jgi:hypothetical protein
MTGSLGTISIINFTPHKVGDASYETAMQREAITLEMTSDYIRERMAFTRRPRGDTPYRNFVNAVNAWSKTLTSENGADKTLRKAIVITDGEPTDQKPGLVIESINKLEQDRIDWASFFVSRGVSARDRLKVHARVLQTAPYGANHYASYPNFDDYFSDIEKLSKRLIPEDVNQVNELPAQVSKFVAPLVQKCSK